MRDAEVNPWLRNGRNPGARKGFKRMMATARMRSVATKKAKAVLKKMGMA